MRETVRDSTWYTEVRQLRYLYHVAGALLAATVLALPVSATAAVHSSNEDPVDTVGVGIALLDVPASALDDPRARTYIVDNVEPGATIERTIEVTNTSTSTHTVTVYSSAATIIDGTFTGSEAATQNTLASWTTLDISEVSLAPDASAQVQVTIAVPIDASEGEQYAAVWAEVRSTPTTDGSSIITANRAGIRIYLSVGAGNGPAADFTIDSLTSRRNSAGDPEIVASVTNSGGRAVDITGTLSLTDGPSGLSAGPFEITTATTLAPGESGEVLVALDSELPNGPWTANLTLVSGLISHDSTAEITFPDAGTGTTVDVTDDSILNIFLFVGGLILVVLLLGAATVFWIKRRTRIKANRNQEDK